MTYSYSAVEKQLCSIATANWDAQYLTAGGIVKDRCFIGRLLKILGLTKIDWVRNILFSSNLPISSLKVKELLVASQNEKSALSDKVKADLHLKVQKQFNKLLYRYNAKASESNQLSTAFIDLYKLFPKADPNENDVPPGVNKKQLPPVIDANVFNKPLTRCLFIPSFRFSARRKVSDAESLGEDESPHSLAERKETTDEAGAAGQKLAQDVDKSLNSVIIENPISDEVSIDVTNLNTDIHVSEDEAGSAHLLPQIDNEQAESAKIPFDKLQWPAWLRGPLSNDKEYLKVFPGLIEAAKTNTLPTLVGDNLIRLHALVCLSNMGPKHPMAKNLAKTQKGKIEVLASIQKGIKTLSLFQQCLLVDIAESKRVSTNAGTRKKLLDNLVENYAVKFKADRNSAECAQLKQCLQDQKDLAKQEKNTIAKVFFKNLYNSIEETSSLQE